MCSETHKLRKEPSEIWGYRSGDNVDSVLWNGTLWFGKLVVEKRLFLSTNPESLLRKQEANIAVLV
jgi:hypothetical protein